MSRYLLHYNKIQQLIQNNIDFVSVVIVDIKGSVPQEVGARMLVTASSEHCPLEGTIGGGKLELAAIKHAQKMLAEIDPAQQHSLLSWNLQKDIGMSCGGVVQLYFELIQHKGWNIAVFGAGHVAQALIPILLTLSCRVWCIDSRKEWLDRLDDSPALTKVMLNDIEHYVSELPSDCSILSLTQGHALDVRVAQAVFEHLQPEYFGIIGSRSKSVAIRRELQNCGISQAFVDQIKCPVGLDIGGDIPSEIAISITAQLLECRGK